MTESYRANTRFADVLMHYINRGLQKWVNLLYTKDTMHEIYQFVLEVVDSTFGKSQQNFTQNAKTWIAQEIYSSIKIGKPEVVYTGQNSEQLSVSPVYTPAKIQEIPTDELRKVGSLFSDSEFAYKIIDELKRRQ